MNKKLLPFGIIALVIVTLAIVLTANRSFLPEDSAIRNPDTLVYISTQDPLKTLDPAYAYEMGSGFIIFNIYETLIFFENEHQDRFIPMLAEQVPSIENGFIRDNGLTYVFPIRSGIDFHYGPVQDDKGFPTPGSGRLEPSDVTYSFHRALLQNRIAGPTSLLLEPLLGVNSIIELAQQLELKRGNFESVEGFDDASPETLVEICKLVKSKITSEGNEVTFHLHRPFAPFLQIIARYWSSILDREFVIAEINDDGNRLHKEAGWDGSCESWQRFYDPIIGQDELFEIANGTGPYKLDRWVKEEEIVLKRNKEYWRERPAFLEKIVLQFTSEWSARLLAIKAGDADIIQVATSNQDQLLPLIEKGVVEVHEKLPTSTLVFLKFNQEINLINNPYVGSGQLDGNGIPTDFFRDKDVRKGFAYAFDYDTYIRDIVSGEGLRANSFMHSTISSFNPNQDSFGTNFPKSEDHLRRAFGGELWEKGFTLVLPHAPGNRLHRSSNELLKYALEQMNPKFHINVQDFQGSQIFQDDAQGRVPLDLDGWHEDFHDPHNWAYPFLHSQGYFSDRMNFEPSIQLQLDQMIDEAMTLQDTMMRKEIYYELQRIAHEEALLIPLDEFLRMRFMRSWLKNYLHNAAFPGVYFWYLKKEETPN
jgi:peptide/nickel transport system substrate-binding protein